MARCTVHGDTTLVYKAFHIYFATVLTGFKLLVRVIPDSSAAAGRVDEVCA